MAAASHANEFTDVEPDQITFVEQREESFAPTVSVDLKSALAATWQDRLDRLEAVLEAESGRPALEAAHLKALLQAGRELAGNGGLGKLCELVLDLSLQAVRASRGVVMTGEKEGDLKSRAIRGEGLRISTAVRDLVMHQGKSLLVRDAWLDRDFASQPAFVGQEIRSVLAVPLQTDERVIGLLYLDSPHLIREFTSEDLNLVTVMANIAAIRIEHARLMEQDQARKLLARELEQAAEIQRRLLPARAPEIAGLDLAGYNAPCRTVGGDYYDFIPYSDGRVALFIADVSGKGLGAALLMSSLQARVQVLFEDSGRLATQLCRLNRSIAANCPDNCFITFFAAVFDPTSSVLTYCNAGHNAPLLLHANGGVEALGATDLPLGIKRDGIFEETSRRLEWGDVLVLYSDGVTEARRPDTDQEFGEQRLIAVVQGKQNEPSASLVEAVNAELLSFTQGAPPADDVTLVAARHFQAAPGLNPSVL
ncbi:MAG TPA: SpoIIE family protein phosphatase [Bryobacteraceae bacterium]|nr:SpoIIE family protein phosphatase [Bryobacteraceae bacterium]